MDAGLGSEFRGSGSRSVASLNKVSHEWVDQQRCPHPRPECY